MTGLRVGAVSRVAGEVTVPGDKSISHRVLILGSLARGRSYAGNLAPGDDVASTARCLARCGASLRLLPDGRAALDGAGPGRSLAAPDGPLDCGNSGTTMRLLAGALAGHDLAAVLDGDASLRRRPMERVAGPLRRMGAGVETAVGGTAPVRIAGRARLHGLRHRLEVSSAQVKSAILLAGLSAEGTTEVEEPAPSRDHTERLLRLCGLSVETDGGAVRLVPGAMDPFGLRVPGDLSSAAFLLALAAARPGWWVRCPGVTLNPGRTGILDVLRSMGARVTVAEGEPAGGVEPAGDVEVAGAHLGATAVRGDLVPRVIDELPVIAVLATQAEGVTEIADAGELRHKEADRIGRTVHGLRQMGATVEETATGMAVTGPARLRPARLDAGGDHRLAMAWAVAAMLAAPGAELTEIDGAEVVGVSFPRFFDALRAIVSAD